MTSRTTTAHRSQPIRAFAAARAKSLAYALAGLGFMFRTQVHARIHALAPSLVVAAGLALRLPLEDWMTVVLACGLVLAAEGVNTAMEHLCDVVCPSWNGSVPRAKDVVAGAVLICAATAALIGALVVAKNL